jgi:hypothetical protein
MMKDECVTIDILAELAVADDMMKKWPKEKLLPALGFPAAATHNMCNWHWKDKDSVTLEEIFELVISSDKDPRPGYLICRMLDFRHFGKKGFFAIVHRLSNVNLGEKCNSFWKAKHQLFLDAHRVKGLGPCNWSIPITEEGKLLARFKNGALYLPKHRGKTGIGRD